MVDNLGAVMVILFVFLMLAAYIQYAQLVEIKLACDNVAKRYLYQMEQTGFLSETDKQNMREDLALAIGLSEAQKNSIRFSGAGTDGTQVPYGGKVELICDITFDNPVSKKFWAADPDTITYRVSMAATSKW